MTSWRRGLASALTAVTLMMFALDASAQLDKLKDTTPEQRANLQTDLMKAKLDLSSEQVAKVAALNRTYAERMEPIIKGAEGRFTKIRQTMEINKAKEAELKKILTLQQFENYLAVKEEIREKFEEKIEQKTEGGRK